MFLKIQKNSHFQHLIQNLQKIFMVVLFIKCLETLKFVPVKKSLFLEKNIDLKILQNSKIVSKFEKCPVISKYVHELENVPRFQKKVLWF